MGTRGRQPIPIERRLLSNPTGHKLPDNRNLTRVTGSGDSIPAFHPGKIPSTPKALPVGKPGRRYWHIYWKFGNAWLASADYPLVLRLCVLHDLSSDIMKQVQAEGLFRESERGHYVNGMVADYLRVIEKIERLESLLGLTPVDRSRIRVQAKEEETGLDAWRKARSSTSS